MGRQSPEDPSSVSMFRFLREPIDPAPLIQWARGRWTNNPTSTLFWAGALLRVWVYLGNRPYWMDEGSLLFNLIGRPIFDFSGPLNSDQLAPPGFLVVERLIIAVLGDSTFATRLFPLICGVAALWLFQRLVDRLLSRPGAILAMVLAALSDDWIYYSSELKPYSCDLAIGLALTLLCVQELGEKSGARGLAPLGLLTIASPWFSFPSLFVAAGCGASLLAVRLIERRGREAVALVAVAGCWAASAFLAVRASGRLLQESTSMYVFWDFAFLPFPPSDWQSLQKAMGILLETFVTPLNLIPPILPHLFAGLAIGFLLLGIVSLARRDPAALGMLIAPLALALAASAMRKYPFHGRLILWLAPAFFLWIAEGAQVLRRRGWRTLQIALVTLLLLYPCLDALYQSSGARARDFNPHGDLRRNQFME